MVSALQTIIDRWHEAHPDFEPIPPIVLPWGAGRNWIVTEAGRRQAGESAAPAAPKKRRSLEERMAHGARQLGITLDEYRQHVEAGEKWCSGHQSWESRQGFGRCRTRPDGLATSCLAYGREYARQLGVYRGRVRYVQGRAS